MNKKISGFEVGCLLLKTIVFDIKKENFITQEEFNKLVNNLKTPEDINIYTNFTYVQTRLLKEQAAAEAYSQYFLNSFQEIDQIMDDTIKGFRAKQIISHITNKTSKYNNYLEQILQLFPTLDSLKEEETKTENIKETRYLLLDAFSYLICYNILIDAIINFSKVKELEKIKIEEQFFVDKINHLNKKRETMYKLFFKIPHTEQQEDIIKSLFQRIPYENMYPFDQPIENFCKKITENNMKIFSNIEALLETKNNLRKECEFFV